ncbi:MAG: type II secretion system F family protein [Pontibacterium sp.]
MPINPRPDTTARKKVLPDFSTLLQPAPGSRERIFFTDQLSLLLETGTNIHAALAILAQQTDNSRMRVLLQDLSRQVAEGRSLSNALSSHPELFNSTYINLIAASESGGFLHKVLERLLTLEERREKLKHQLASTATYPAFLILFSVAVLLFILLVVFPEFQTMFEAIMDQLPWTTRVLMATSDLMRTHWGGISLVTSLLITGAILCFRSPGGRRVLDRLKLRLPLIRQIMIQLYLTESLRVLGLSLQNGVNILDALASTRDVVRNQQFHDFILHLEHQIAEGMTLASGFSAPPWMPSLAKQLIQTGEDTGNLPRVMERLADHYERELGKRLETVSKLAEPVMLLIMGLIVGVLVSSLILPIFKLSQVVH